MGGVEEAGGGGAGEGEARGGGLDDVAFGAHLGGEGGVVGVAKQGDVEAGGVGGGDAALGEGFAEVVGGEGVFGVAGRAEDLDAAGERLIAVRGDLAGLRDEV